MSQGSNFQTFEAAGTITEFAAVKLDAANKVVITTTAVEPSIIGIAQTAAVSGDKITVCVDGLTRMVAGAAITPATNNQLMADASGRMINATSTHYVVASVVANSTDLAYANGEQFIGLFKAPSIVKA